MSIDPDAAEMLQFKKERMEEQKKMLELRKIEAELRPLIQEIQFKKAVITELKVLVRRLESEVTRSKHDLERQKREENDALNNLEIEKKGLSENENTSGKSLKDLESEIKKEQEIIKEHQAKLALLMKKSNDIKSGSEKKNNDERGILFRLSKVFEREKKETQTAEMVLKDFIHRLENARMDMDRFTREFENLNSRLEALKRKL